MAGAILLSLANSQSRKQNCRNLLTKRGAEKDSCAMAQITAVGQHNANAAKNANTRLHSRVEQPLPRPELTVRIGDGPGIKKWAQLNAKECSAIKCFVQF